MRLALLQLISAVLLRISSYTWLWPLDLFHLVSWIRKGAMLWLLSARRSCIGRVHLVVELAYFIIRIVVLQWLLLVVGGSCWIGLIVLLLHGFICKLAPWIWKCPDTVRGVLDEISLVINLHVFLVCKLGWRWLEPNIVWLSRSTSVHRVGVALWAGLVV